MTLLIRMPGITSTGSFVPRYKTTGPGTLRAFDLKNPATYPSGIVPATAIPSGTALYDLPTATVETPSVPATMVGASVQSAGGGIQVGTGKYIVLPNDFIIPSLAGIDGHYLIIVSAKFTTPGAPVAAEYVAGHATNTSTNCNWMLYRNAGNAALFAAINGQVANVTALGALSAGFNRIGMEFIRDNTAGTIAVKGYLNGILTASPSPVAGASFPQPATTPRLGGAGFTGGGFSGGGEVGSGEIRNLTNDTKSAAEIVAEDWSAWGTRFA
jgi:hypothetical protein